MKVDRANIDRVNNIYEKYQDHNLKMKNDREFQKEIKKEKVVNIEISDTAKSLINTIAQSKDAAFSEKVEGIRKSIIGGAYKVSPDQIADKILQVLESQEGSGK